MFGGDSQVGADEAELLSSVRVRGPPETFCRILIIRISRSARCCRTEPALMVNRMWSIVRSKRRGGCCVLSPGWWRGPRSPSCRGGRPTEACLARSIRAQGLTPVQGAVAGERGVHQVFHGAQGIGGLGGPVPLACPAGSVVVISKVPP